MAAAASYTKPLAVGRNSERISCKYLFAIAAITIIITSNYLMGASLSNLLLPSYLNNDEATYVNTLMSPHNSKFSPPGRNKGRPKIAIMSSFVPNRDVKPPPKLSDAYFDHIVNKACYSYIWGYDFIFNTTFGFDSTYPNWHWLNFGTWHRVPHVIARIQEYDWILYTDTDFAIKDIMRPIESFIEEWELYNKTNVQLFVPVDSYGPNMFTFSAFAFMIHNSDFGMTLLQHWLNFARGMCPRGNMNQTNNGRYTWEDTDQPGLWYSMLRTFNEYYPDRVVNFRKAHGEKIARGERLKQLIKDDYPQCNNETGVFDFRPPGWNDYYLLMNLTKGSTGSELSKIANDQPYIWSSKQPDGGRTGMALQLTYGTAGITEADRNAAYGLHLKKPAGFPSPMLAELEYCKHHYGCYAHYNEVGKLKIGCGDTVYL